MIFYGGDVGVLEDDSLRWTKVLTLVEPYLGEAPFAEFCGDVVMVTDTPSIEHTNPIWNELLDLSPVSSALLPTTPSHLHAYYESLGDIRVYYLSLDLYGA